MFKLVLNKTHLLYFCQQNMFSNESLKMNSYFSQQLNNRKLFPLKDFQIETLNTVELQNKNCFINSCTGSGKTLAYLLPIMNKIFKEKQILIKQKSNQNNKQFQYQNNTMHGAIIFTLNKELSLQIYKEIRLLDSQNKLNVYRTGPISHFAPVIQLLNKKQKTPQQQDQIAQGVDRNIIKCVNWSRTDILIATPHMFYNIMTQIIHNKNNLINPKFIVIDQADLLLEIDQNLAKYMEKIISLIKHENNRLTKNVKNFFHQQKSQGNHKKKGEKQNQVRYLMSSSSFPKKINKVSSQQYFEKHFKPLKIITGINKHRLPERVDLKYIQIQSKSQIGQQNSKVDDQKLFYLAKILTDPQKKGNRFIIFCSSKKNVEKISQFLLQKLKLNSIQYYAGLPSDQRSMNLYKFTNESFDILISTDLGSRGLDFKRPIHTVIQYDMAQNIVNFINRGGRTARNQLPGQIISFVEDKNKIFFQQLASKNSQDEEFDDLFSRKRSYSKMVLKYLKQEAEYKQKL